MKPRTAKPANRLLPPFALALLLAGCASADPTLYTLQAISGTPAPASARIIEVRRPGLAGYLDRSDIVLKNTAYRLDVNSQLRWAEPLGDMIGRVLTQDLSQRLPGSSVFQQSGAITANADFRVEVDIQGLDPDGAGNLVLTAQVAVEAGSSHTPVASRHVVLTTQPEGPGAGALAAAISKLLGQLSDGIAGNFTGV